MPTSEAKKIWQLECGYAYHAYESESFQYPNERDSRRRFLFGKIGIGDIFLDIGANVGSWTLPAMMMGAKVYAVEPGEHFVAELGKNIALNENSFLHRIHSRPIIIQDIVYDHLRDDMAYDGWFSKPGGNRRSTTIDAIVQYNSLVRVNYIKIDVECCEREVLIGAEQTISAFQPKILVEVHTPTVKVSDITDKLLALHKDYMLTILPQDGGDYYHVFGEKLT